jgi:hypothetical protein
MAIYIFTQSLYFNILQSKTKKKHGVHDFWHLFKTLVDIDEDGHDVAHLPYTQVPTMRSIIL